MFGKIHLQSHLVLLGDFLLTRILIHLSTSFTRRWCTRNGFPVDKIVMTGNVVSLQTQNHFSVIKKFTEVKVIFNHYVYDSTNHPT